MKNATIGDVAKAAGVDRSTVSRALNDKGTMSVQTRERIKQIAEGLGYSPSPIAQSLKGCASMTVGVIVPLITNPHNMKVVDGINDIMYPAGYTMLIAQTANDILTERSLIDCFLKRRVDGIFVVSSEPDSTRMRSLIERGTPIVLIERRYENADIDMVGENPAESTRMLTGVLIANGHKKIAFFYGHTEIPSFSNRYKGFLTAMEDAGIEVEKRYLIDVSTDPAKAYNAAIELMTSPSPPTAILSYNSIQTENIYRALKTLKIEIPKDVSLISCNQVYAQHMLEHPITCAMPQYTLIGRSSAALMLKRIEQKARGEFPHGYQGTLVEIPPFFEVGETVKKL